MKEREKERCKGMYRERDREFILSIPHLPDPILYDRPIFYARRRKIQAKRYKEIEEETEEYKPIYDTEE